MASSYLVLPTRLVLDWMMNEELKEIAIRLQIGNYQRHIFLCVGPSCCSAQIGAGAWKKLKDELKARNLSLSDAPSACYRTKVQCLRICTGGPILVVYPEGYWYSGMTEDRIDRFIDEQILKGEPIEEWIFARNPIG
ncbi:MAG: ferredoxin [Planctomycetota bacterium]|jgi:(2Fe-2S) ferredoxin|nr:ferredoxin [Planctomycetota bacterium]